MDLDDQADEAWLLSVQRKLYQWSRTHPEDSYRDVWNWITDIRNLRCAWRKIALNKGRRTAGVDGMTVAGISVAMGMELFLEQLHGDLKSGRYKPSPSRRKLIPKPRQPGKFRPLGIPTVRDRVVQCAVKNILEPIFEAGFWHVSYGFRPGRGCHGALEHIRHEHATASEGRRWPTSADALPMGHRRRYQGLLRQHRSPPVDEAGSRSRHRWQGNEVDRAVLESPEFWRMASCYRQTKALLKVA